MQSIWMKDYINQNLPIINDNIHTPILIIGGGIAGLMCAYNLMKKNMGFVLVEREKLANGVSANTTAQITIAHDNLYEEITKKYNEEKAVSYLKSQTEGLEIIKNIIKLEKIKCDLKEESTILYANEKKNIKTLNFQFNMIKNYNKNTKMLFSNKDFIRYERAIEFDNQLIFNPIKYMMGIINILIKNKSQLYENSVVTKINKKDNIYEVIINDNQKVYTNKIIMACHYPFLNPDNLYFAKIYQSKSYAIAFNSKLKLKSNYVSLDEPYYYLRTYDNSTLILGGSDHFTGINTNIEKNYKILTDKIYELDKNAKILYKWFTEDCMTIDSLPFVGKYSHKNPDIILVTGFQKWGFTNSHIAAKEITNIILNIKYNDLYNTYRYTLFRDFKSTFRMIGHIVNGLIISKLNIKKYKLNNINIKSGKVMKYKKINVLVYREDKNHFIFLKNKCTHMGCSLIWNDVDKVWESKCHGSIFDRYGKVIYGPAIKDLERVEF